MRMAIVGKVNNGRITTMMDTGKGIQGYSRKLVSTREPLTQVTPIAPVPTSVELPDFMNRHMAQRRRPISPPTTKGNEKSFYDYLKHAIADTN